MFDQPTGIEPRTLRAAPRFSAHLAACILWRRVRHHRRRIGAVCSDAAAIRCHQWLLALGIHFAFSKLRRRQHLSMRWPGYRRWRIKQWFRRLLRRARFGEVAHKLPLVLLGGLIAAHNEPGISSLAPSSAHGRIHSLAAERLHRLPDQTSNRLAAVVRKLGLLSE
jgi:hypothetical protein